MQAVIGPNATRRCHRAVQDGLSKPRRMLSKQILVIGCCQQGMSELRSIANDKEVDILTGTIIQNITNRINTLADSRACFCIDDRLCPGGTHRTTPRFLVVELGHTQKNLDNSLRCPAVPQRRDAASLAASAEGSHGLPDNQGRV
jgi:hypothetical protein